MRTKKNMLVVFSLLFCILIGGCTDNNSTSNNESIGDSNIIYPELFTEKL